MIKEHVDMRQRPSSVVNYTVQIETYTSLIYALT